MNGNLCRSTYVQKEQKDVAVGEISVWKKGKKGRKEMQKDGKRQIHVLKAKYLQKDACTEERKCFAEANT